MPFDLHKLDTRMKLQNLSHFVEEAIVARDWLE